MLVKKMMTTPPYIRGVTNIQNQRKPACAVGLNVSKVVTNIQLTLLTFEREHFMFTALYYGEKIDISDYSAPKMALSKDGLRCLFCNAPLFIKAGLIRAAHFSHYPENTCQFETLQGEPETPKHRALKDFIWKRGFIDCPLVIIWVDTEILDIKTSPSLRVVIIGNPTWIKRHCVHSIRQSFKERVVLRSFLK